MSSVAAKAIAVLEAAGFVVGPELLGELIAVRRTDSNAARVWLDIGDTVSLLGDRSDPGNALYFDVIEALDGPEGRERAQASQ